MTELPDAVYHDLLNRLGHAKHTAEEINDLLAFKDDPVGVIFWWSEPNEHLGGECPKDLLFDRKDHAALREAAHRLIIPVVSTVKDLAS